MLLAEKFKLLLSDIKKFFNKSVSKTFISNEASITIASFQDSIETITKLQEMNKIDPTIAVALRKDKQYLRFIRGLSGGIAIEETKMILASLKIISDIYVREIDGLLKYVTSDQTSDKFVNITDIKYSQITFIGLLEQANKIDRFVKAFIFKTFYFQNMDNFKKELPWLYKSIEDNNDLVVNQMNRYSNNYNSTKTSILDQITGFFKKKNYDPNIIVESKANVNYISLLEDDSQMRNLGILGLPFSINVFTIGANAYMLYNHNRNIQREYEKAAMENHVFALELRKNKFDPESAEYKKLEKVIANYNTLIASATKSIDEYKNS